MFLDSARIIATTEEPLGLDPPELWAKINPSFLNLHLLQHFITATETKLRLSLLEFPSQETRSVQQHPILEGQKASWPSLSL